MSEPRPSLLDTPGYTAVKAVMTEYVNFNWLELWLHKIVLDHSEVPPFPELSHNAAWLTLTQL